MEEHEVTMLAPPSMMGEVNVGQQAPAEEQYEMVAPIGSGSFGQVFLVVHRAEGRQYVMKKLALMATMDEKSREATELEVNLLSAMRHPNIVAYRDSFINSEGHLCILMEYCKHGDISTFLQQAKKVGQMPDEGRLVEWFIHVALALHALHLKKILHRDLKTQNIFLARSNNVLAAKLGDFGISRVLNSTTDLARTQIGTPFYMSPELINNKPYSYKSDIWGLGCVLYEMINGQRAFDAQSLNALALKIINGHYTPITSSCSPETKSLIKSMLSKTPSHRPSLKEILHITSVRRRIPAALSAVVACSEAAGGGEMRAESEEVLMKQLVALGLGSLLGGGASAAARTARDHQRLLKRLEQAEGRKQREEEALVRLQKTAALLKQSLSGPGGASIPEVTPSWNSSAGAGQGSPLRRPRAHTEESPSTDDAGHSGPSFGHSMSEKQDCEAKSSLSCLLDYDHISTANLENPFQSYRPNVVHSPRRKRSVEDGFPPPPAYGEPVPPLKAPPSSMRSTWRTTDPRESQRRSRPPRAVSLKALNSDHPSENEFSDESHTSVTQSEDNVLDVSSGGWASEEQFRKQSYAVQQRIDRCRSAINRREMTIGMLEYSFSQEKFPEGGTSWTSLKELKSSNTESSIDLISDDGADAAQSSAAGTYRRGGGAAIAPTGASAAPAFVQDCVARLTRRCLEGLGSDKFQAAKRLMQALMDAADVPGPGTGARQSMLELLGLDKIGFYSLIDQIVFMERKWGSQDVT